MAANFSRKSGWLFINFSADRVKPALQTRVYTLTLQLQFFNQIFCRAALYPSFLEVLERCPDPRIIGFLLRYYQLLVALLGKHHVLRLIVADDMQITLGYKIIHRCNAAPLEFLCRYGVHTVDSFWYFIKYCNHNRIKLGFQSG